MSESPVLFHTEPTSSGHLIGVATLNRPQQLNALNLAMCERMLAQFRAWVADEQVVCVLLEGTGDKGFCAGGDVAEAVRHLRGLVESPDGNRFAYGDTFFTVEYELDLLIHQYPKPLVALSHGVCMGGGLGLVAGASHRVFVDDSKIAMPEIHIGLFPDVGGGYFLNRGPVGVGQLMALTGLIITAEDARYAGLADAVVTADARAGLIAALRRGDWTLEARHNRAVASLAVRDQPAPVNAAPSALETHASAVKALADADDVIAYRDALQALAAREPHFASAARNLSQGSPTAAHVTFEYLRRTRGLRIADVLVLDLKLAKQFQRHHDFSEGVRALLIDKDRAPKWSPAQWPEVSVQLVAAHFLAL
jgi:enoyl-CoA hydratase/carnithine racemase